jgi:hypothetical protein
MTSAAQTSDEPVTLLGAAAILRREAERDTSRSQNDKAELRIAAAVCEGVAQRV